MKYLIQHTKEFIITIFVFLTIALVLLWAVSAIISGDFSYENFIALIGAVFEAMGWYYNMPTSEENCEATGEMRHKKDEKKSDYVGEKFFEGDDDE